jgi:hypothetical protein
MTAKVYAAAFRFAASSTLHYFKSADWEGVEFGVIDPGLDSSASISDAA